MLERYEKESLQSSGDRNYFVKKEVVRWRIVKTFTSKCTNNAKIRIRRSLKRIEIVLESKYEVLWKNWVENLINCAIFYSTWGHGI